MGPGISAAKMREALQDELLAERRKNAVLRVANKCLASDRFGQWFPTRPCPSYPRRVGVVITFMYDVEENYRTERRKNSPLCHMRQKTQQPVDQQCSERANEWRTLISKFNGMSLSPFK